MRFDEELLQAAKMMPEAASLLRHLRLLCDLFAGMVGVDIDCEKFSAVAIRDWERHHTPDGLSLEPLALAANIEQAAALTLNQEQRQQLRRNVADMNERLARKAKEIKG